MLKKPNSETFEIVLSNQQSFMSKWNFLQLRILDCKLF
jgi:hypothetical protein